MIVFLITSVVVLLLLIVFTLLLVGHVWIKFQSLSEIVHISLVRMGDKTNAERVQELRNVRAYHDN